MNHFDKIAAALPAAGLDGVLLTGEHNRFYASGFASHGADGGTWTWAILPTVAMVYRT